MTAIWVDTVDGQWEELTPAGFSLEDHLQSMVFRSVGMLPLAGSPVVIALAREVEVPFTKGRVDVVGVDVNGTPVLIEVKRKANQEARDTLDPQLQLQPNAYYHGGHAAAHPLARTHRGDQQ